MSKFRRIAIAFLFASTPFFALAETATSTSQISPTVQLSICSKLDKDLRFGSTDKNTNGAVTLLQNYLNELGYYPHPGLGVFGWQTYYAVAEFQKTKGLPATGYFGPLSRALVKNSSCGNALTMPATQKALPTTTASTTAITRSATTTRSFVPPTVATSTTTSTPAETNPFFNEDKNQAAFERSKAPSSWNGAAALTPSASSTEVQSNSASSSIDAAVSGQITLPYKKDYSNFDNWNDWQFTWGSASTSPEGIFTLNATASTTGAEAVLRGSENWTDYSYTAGVVANVNGSFSLLGRYTDDNNFLACVFGGNSVSIQKRVDGKTTTLTKAKLDQPPPLSIFISTNVSIKIEGDRVVCSATGAEDAAATFTDPELAHGGIGVSIWFSTAGITSLQLRSVNVTAL